METTMFNENGPRAISKCFGLVESLRSDTYTLCATISKARLYFRAPLVDLEVLPQRITGKKVMHV